MRLPRALLLLPVSILALLVVVADAGLAAEGDFRPIGPFGGNVLALGQSPVDPSVVFAGTYSGGLFFSDDGGRNWEIRRQGIEFDIHTGRYESIRGITVAAGGERVYLVGSSGLYVSENKGMSWNKLPRPADSRPGFTQLIVDGADTQRLYTGNGPNGSGVFTSEDGGQTWSMANAGIADADLRRLRCLEPAGGTQLLMIADRTLYRSETGAVTWSVAGTLPGAGFRDFRVDPSDVNRLYLALDEGAFLSENGGLAWTRLDDEADKSEISAFVVGDAEVIGIGRGGLWTVTGTGESAHLVRGADFVHTRATDVLADVDGELLVSTEMGVFAGTEASIAAGGALEFRSHGLRNADINKLVAAPSSDVLYAACGQGHDAGLFRSEDNGDSWQLRSMGLRNPDIRSMAVFPGNPDVVYLGTADATDDFGENGTIYRTVDGGMTWKDVSAGLPHDDQRIIISLAVDPVDADVVYASVQSYFGGIFKSVDGGETWVRNSTGLQSMPPMPGFDDNPFIDYFAMLSLAIDPGNRNRIYIGAGGCWGGVYISDNAAHSWTRLAEGPMEVDSEPPMPMMFGVHLELFEMVIDPADPTHLISTGGRGAFPGGSLEGGDQVGIAYESRDSGATWKILRDNSRSDYFVTPITGVVIDPVRDERIYLSTRDGLKMSTSAGKAGTWTYENAGLTGIDKFTRSAIMDPDDPDKLYLATAFSGVWVRDLAPTPVRLSHFSAEALAGEVLLSWGVSEAHDHAGFHVERELRGVRTRLTPSLLGGSAEYRFVDASPAVGETQRYHLLEMSRSGRLSEVGQVEVTVPRPRSLTLGPAHPNPLQTSTRLNLTTATPGRVTVRVFDALGRVVATPLDRVLPAGNHEVVWNPQGSDSVNLVPGVYFLRIEQGGESAVRKVMLLP